MTKQQKINLRNKALTDLFNSQQLQKKIEGICLRHYIPMEAGIQEDILQTVFENLIKYDLEKFIKAYQDNPNRILALAVDIAVKKGVAKDTRVPSGFRASIGQSIIHQSNLTSPFKIGFEGVDDMDDEHNHNIKQVIKSEDEGYYSLEQQQENEFMELEQQEDFKNLWVYIRQNLSEAENEVLQQVLKPEQGKLKGKIKKQYLALLPNIKTLIKKYYNR